MIGIEAIVACIMSIDKMTPQGCMSWKKVIICWTKRIVACTQMLHKRASIFLSPWSSTKHIVYFWRRRELESSEHHFTATNVPGYYHFEWKKKSVSLGGWCNVRGARFFVKVNQSGWLILMLSSFSRWFQICKSFWPLTLHIDAQSLWKDWHFLSTLANFRSRVIKTYLFK